MYIFCWGKILQNKRIDALSHYQGDEELHEIEKPVSLKNAENQDFLGSYLSEDLSFQKKNKSSNKQKLLYPETNRFKELVTKYQHLYVDKTSFIREVLEKHDKHPILLITRPSGWGKSVNLTMLKNFLETKVSSQGCLIEPSPNLPLFLGGKMIVEEEIQHKMKAGEQKDLQAQQIKLMQERGLDENSKRGRSKIIQICRRKQQNRQDERVKREYNLRPLKASKLRQGKMTVFYREQFGKHPVIYIDFGKITKNTLQGIKQEIFQIIHSAYMKHSYLLNTKLHGQFSIHKKHLDEIIRAPEKVEWSPLDNLLMNMKETLEEYFKTSCYIMVDNYDYPVLKLLKNQNMSEIRQMAALIASLFTDFSNREYVPPSSGVKAYFKRRGQRSTSTRAILMGKTNIFSTYLSAYVHYSICDPNFSNEFGLTDEDINETLLFQVLNTLKDNNQYTHFELQSPDGFTEIKQRLTEKIRIWYGGNMQQLGNSEKNNDDFKYGFSQVWQYLKQYIMGGIVGLGKSCWVSNDGDLEEKWYLRRIFKSLNVSKMFEYQLRNPPCIKLNISDFLSPDCRTSSYLSGPQMIYLGYSLGYFTGVFLPIGASQTYIVQPHFPNLDVQNKFKSAILQNFQPFFNSLNIIKSTPEQKSEISNGFSLQDSQIFKNNFENLINKLLLKDHRDQVSPEDECSYVFYLGVIFYQVLHETSCGYVPASAIQTNSLLYIDNLFFKAAKEAPLKQNQKQKVKAILIDIRHCKTSNELEINSLFYSAIRDIYESKLNLQRLVSLADSNMNISETYVKIRIGVMAHWEGEPHHKLFLLDDVSHSYSEIIKINNFFLNKRNRSKWKKAHYLLNFKENQLIAEESFDFEKVLAHIVAIGKGKGDQIFDKMKRIIKKLKFVKGKYPQKYFDPNKFNQDSQGSEEEDLLKERQKEMKRQRRTKRQSNLEVVYFEPGYEVDLSQNYQFPPITQGSYPQFQQDSSIHESWADAYKSVRQSLVKSSKNRSQILEKMNIFDNAPIKTEDEHAYETLVPRRKNKKFQINQAHEITSRNNYYIERNYQNEQLRGTLSNRGNKSHKRPFSIARQGLYRMPDPMQNEKLRKSEEVKNERKTRAQLQLSGRFTSRYEDRFVNNRCPY